MNVGKNLNLAGNTETEKASQFPKMVQLIMKWFGFVEQKQVEYVFLGFVVVAIAVSFFLFFGNVGNSRAKPLTNSQIEQIIKNQQGVQFPR